MPLVTSGEHYGAVINPDFDYRRYLAALQADGLNYTRLFGGSYVEVPAKSFGILRNDLAPQGDRFLPPWARSDQPGYAGGGNKFDLNRWNEGYFERLRDFLTEASKRGIVVEITLFSSHYQEAQWKVSPFHPSNNVNGTGLTDWKMLHTLANGGILRWQESYTRKLVNEANGFDNVIFEIQNEPWSDRGTLADVMNPYLAKAARDQYPNSIDIADELSITWQTRVAQWITSEESKLPNHHLIAQNYCNFRLPVRELAPGAGIINFHYSYPEAVLLNYGMGKPISYDETGFLGHDDAAYLRQAWNFMLSGGAIFDNLDYSFSVGREDGSDSEPNGPGGGSAGFRRQLRVLVEFLGKLPLDEMAPDSGAVVHASGVYARVLSSPQGRLVVYLDGNGPAELTLRLPKGRYAGEWIDVRTGKTLKAEKFLSSGGQQTLAPPAFANGIALRLERN